MSPARAPLPPPQPITVGARPTPFSLPPGRTALLVLDMQRDWLDTSDHAASRGLDVQARAAAVPARPEPAAGLAQPRLARGARPHRPRARPAPLPARLARPHLVVDEATAGSSPALKAAALQLAAAADANPGWVTDLATLLHALPASLHDAIRLATQAPAALPASPAAPLG